MNSMVNSMIDTKSNDIQTSIENLRTSLNYFDDLMNLLDMDVFNIKLELDALESRLKIRLAKPVVEEE